MAILVAEPTQASLSDMSRALYLAEHFNVPAYIVINKATMNPDFDGIEAFAEEKGLEIIGRIPYDDSIPHSLRQRKPYLEVGSGPAKDAIIETVRRVEDIIEDTGLMG